MANNRNSAEKGETVRLNVQYYGIDGLPSDADFTPSIEIRDVNGDVIIAETSEGVTKLETGLYYYDYYVASDSGSGMWIDTWNAQIQGVSITDAFNFLVITPGSEELGSVRIGDDVAFDFSEEELAGINILLKYLKARLRSDGRKPKRDEYGAFVRDENGEIVYVECNVFSDELLVCFLCQALSEFNMIPFFTTFSFADRIIFTTFSQIIVEAAMVFAMASQALVEKGRDFTISDGGVSYQPPALGDFLASQYNNFLSNYRERVKFIKNNIRPGPKGFGTYTNLTSGSPAFARLRHLRARRII
jgi:hypothetical protein